TVSNFAGLAGYPGGVDGIGSAARFNVPHDLWGDGTFLYVADFTNRAIRRIAIANAQVTTFAGALGVLGTTDAPSGPATSARFQSTNGVWGDGTNLYVADRLAHTIRQIVIATGAVTTIAGTASTSG